MSEEATISASSLLSSLLGATATNSLPTQLANEQIGLSGENASTFGELLGSNIGAEGSFSDGDGAFAQLAPVQNPFANTDRLAVMSDDLSRQLSNHPTQFAASDLEHSGINIPTSGSILPLESPLTAPLDSQGFLQTIDNGFISSTKEQPEAPSVDMIDPRLESLVDNGDDVTAPPQSPEPLAALTPDLPSPIAAASASDLSGGRPRDLAAATSAPGFVNGTLDTDNNSDFSGDLSFDQQFSDGSQDAPSDLRKPAGPTAEFALDTPRRGDFQSSLTTLSTLPTGELGNTALPQFNQVANSSSALASTSLTLVADRQLAGQQIAQHIASFVQQGNDSFEINLSPPHLGKITARILLQNDQASVVLTAPSADIRELIEASLPKLGNLLEDAGFNLADANVSSQNQGDNPKEQADGAQLSEPNSTPQETAIAAPQQLLRGLLDAYA